MSLRAGKPSHRDCLDMSTFINVSWRCGSSMEATVREQIAAEFMYSVPQARHPLMHLLVQLSDDLHVASAMPRIRSKTRIAVHPLFLHASVRLHIQHLRQTTPPSVRPPLSTVMSWGGQPRTALRHTNGSPTNKTIFYGGQCFHGSVGSVVGVLGHRGRGLPKSVYPLAPHVVAEDWIVLHTHANVRCVDGRASSRSNGAPSAWQTKTSSC